MNHSLSNAKTKIKKTPPVIIGEVCNVEINGGITLKLNIPVHKNEEYPAKVVDLSYEGNGVVKI